MTSLVEAIGHARHCPTVCLTADKATAWFAGQIEAAVAAERERIASAIEATFSDPERVRPLVPTGEFATDLANDWQWAALIARREPS